MAQPRRYFEGRLSKQPVAPHVNKTFNERFMEVYGTLPPVELTPEQLAEIAAQIELTDYVLKETGKSLLADTEAAKIHISGSDNQDLSGLQPRETGKGLSTNDYTDAEESKLAGIEAGANNYTHPTNHPPSIISQDASNRFVSDTEKSTWNGKEPGNSNIQNHVTSAHAPSDAQPNNISDVNAGLLTGGQQTILHSHAGGAGGLGYAINIQALTSSPADGATVYFGMLPKAPTTTANISKIHIRKPGTIKIANIPCYSGTAGTNQAWSLYIRKNNTTDYLIATLSVATNERIFSNSNLDIPVIVGDYVEIKGVQPTWTTNPLTTIYGGYLYLE